MLSDLVRAWTLGWTVSRETPPPVEEPLSLRIDVGHPRQAVRHVVLDPTEATVRKLTEAVTEPATWLKSAVAPDLIAPWLPDGWVEDAPGFLMAIDLRAEPVVLADGYAMTHEARGGVTRLQIRAADGSPAAHGQVAVPHEAAVAVVDRVETDPAHQRRGLGSVIMKTLAATALDAGATSAVLGATIEGRALYEALGWTVRAPLAGFIYQPATGTIS
jgi:GNAT superfamily N-acetyltransferase